METSANESSTIGSIYDNAAATIAAVGFGDDAIDAAARKRIEGYFPGRDVHIIELLASWYGGGGVHCHTNDQPAL
jgi:agmatine deiminase